MELDQLLVNRKSIRRYQYKELDQNVLIQLIQAGQMAPSWKNSQVPRYHMVVTQNKLLELQDKGLAAFNAENTENVSCLLVMTFVKDRSGFDREGRPSNEVGNGWGFYDTGLATANLLLKATELGLSTLIMGIRDAEKIRELLNIPDDEIIVSVIGIGQGDIDPERPERKSVEEISVFY